MSGRAHGQIRQGQIITTYGPGALIDLPRHSAIVGGLDNWPKPANLVEIVEPRLSRKLGIMTGVPSPRLYAPPPESNDPSQPAIGITAWRFPEWFVVQDEGGGQDRERSRRLVHRKALDDRGRFDGKAVVATRFVRACPRGHVDDLDWRAYVHGPDDACRRQLWLDERGTSGDLGDLFVRCECNKSRPMHEATQFEMKPLGTCPGMRPWLGRNTREDCHLPARLLIRTASNAYFPQVVSVLSLPDRASAVESAVGDLWGDLQVVESPAELPIFKRKPAVAAGLAGFSDEEVLAAIASRKRGGAVDERPVKQVELDALVAAPEGFGDDVPVDQNFHARRLPERTWRRTPRSDGIEAVIQLHRLREVLALAGFTRLEPAIPTSTGSTRATSSGRRSRSSRPGFRPWRTAGKGCSCCCARTPSAAGWSGRP